MNKLIALVAIALSVSLTSQADIVLTNQVTTTITRPVTTVVSSSITVMNVKAVWSSFSINYAPPAYTSCTYTVVYHLQDLKTKNEVPNSRVVVRLTEKQVTDFATSLGVNFNEMGIGIGGLLNEYLKTLFIATTPPPVVE